jgi:hypothetical protein
LLRIKVALKIGTYAHGKLGQIKQIVFNLKENGKSLIPLSLKDYNFFARGIDEKQVMKGKQKL